MIVEIRVSTFMISFMRWLCIEMYASSAPVGDLPEAVVQIHHPHEVIVRVAEERALVSGGIMLEVPAAQAVEHLLAGAGRPAAGFWSLCFISKIDSRICGPCDFTIDGLDADRSRDRAAPSAAGTARSRARPPGRQTCAGPCLHQLGLRAAACSQDQLVQAARPPPWLVMSQFVPTNTSRSHVLPPRPLFSALLRRGRGTPGRGSPRSARPSAC
jgi:hypothetical protein